MFRNFVQEYCFQLVAWSYFHLGNDGYFSATNANITGIIKAISGEIGGCTIDEAGIYSGTGNGTAGMGLQGSRYAFWAGGTIDDTGSAKFVVGHDGTVKATLGSIGGCTINNGGIHKGTASGSISY